MDSLRIVHEHPGWIADGMSLLPLITQLQHGAGNSYQNDTSHRSAAHPLVFKLGKQTALIDNDLKILENPTAGMCPAYGGGVYSGTRLFNLTSDPTESDDLSGLPGYEFIFKNMSAKLVAFKSSISMSRVNESECAVGPVGGAKRDTTAVLQTPDVRQVLPACISPFVPSPSPSPSPPPPPPPSPPPSPPFMLTANASTASGYGIASAGCLTAVASVSRAGLTVSPCAKENTLQQWQTNSGGKLFLTSALCLKTTEPNTCAPGAALWLGQNCADPHGFVLNGSAVHLVLHCGGARNSGVGHRRSASAYSPSSGSSGGSWSMCLGQNGTSAYLGYCKAETSKWTKIPLPA